MYGSGPCPGESRSGWVRVRVWVRGGVRTLRRETREITAPENIVKGFDYDCTTPTAKEQYEARLGQACHNPSPQRSPISAHGLKNVLSKAIVRDSRP